ncbi:MAG: TspO/MBR family protein [Hyphomonadaceae bacterium]
MTATSPPTSRQLPPAAMYTAFAALTLAVAALGATVSGGESDPWYAALDKAPGTPPGWVFGVVWPILYALMAISACLAWRAASPRERASVIAIYVAQLFVNLAWSCLFFGLHQPATAFADIAVLLSLTIWMAYAFGAHSRIAGLLQVPYILWLCFAGYLNAWIVFTGQS